MTGPGHHYLGVEERELVDEVLSDWSLSRYAFDEDGTAAAPMVYRLEREVESRLGARHCLALNSGTSALFTALAALEIGPGDEVIVPGYCFVADVAVVVHRGAVPVLAEIDESLTIDPEDAERRITSRTRAILAVHMLGAPCDMDALRELAERHGLLVVEDAAQACGATYRGQRVGTIGAAGAFSLNTFKVITAGDGGFLTTNDESVYRRAFAFHNHGYQPARFGVMDGDLLLGLNFRMPELVGAVALAQVRKLDRVLADMRALKARLEAALGDLGPVRLRSSRDPGGDCGSVVGLLFPDGDGAARAAAALGVRRLIDSGRHYYGNIVPVLERHLGGDAAARADMLPRTDDLLSRVVLLSVGVSDSYLGAGFGIAPGAGGSDIRATADRARRVIQEAL